MQINVRRTFKGQEYTIGKLYIDGHYLCDTLEDTVRPAGIKIAGKTAIPAGTYKVKKTMSPRFKKVLPEILNVPGFSGVRIHAGNYADRRTYLKTIAIPSGYDILNTKEHVEVV
jgi:hypothetical protein